MEREEARKVNDLLMKVEQADTLRDDLLDFLARWFDDEDPCYLPTTLIDDIADAVDKYAEKVDKELYAIKLEKKEN